MATKIPHSLSEQDIIDFTKHKEDIRIAAADASKLITDTAKVVSENMKADTASAAKMIAEAAAVAVRVVSIKNADDHDLLIELKVGNQFIRDDIQRLSSGISTQISELQKSKADKVDFDLLAEEVRGIREKRLRDVENKSANYMITMALAMVAIAALFTIIITHILK